MSPLKLTATASIYVRTATTTTTTTTTKPSSLPLLWKTRRSSSNSSSSTNTTIHHPQPGWRMITPSPHVLSLSKNLGFSVALYPKPLSFSSSILRGSQKSGFWGCGYGSPSRSGLVTDAGSESKDREISENEPLPPSMQDSSQSSKLLTLPTILTLGRVAAVPLLVATFYMDGWRGTAATTSIFITAAVTDWLDGYIARKMKLKSSFGAFLDPVADKLMVAATLVLLCTRPLDVAVFGQAPWLLTVPSIVIIGREITMSAVREWAASQDSKLLEAVAVNNLGKWKTATQMTALTILLATRDWSHGGAAMVVGSGVALLYVSAGLAMWSLVVYVRKIWKVLLR